MAETLAAGAGGIGVITNPRSRVNLRHPELTGKLKHILGASGTLEQPADLDELAAVAREFKAREIDVVGVSGGDGTLHTVLTALAAAYGEAPLPRVAILRTGTMNTVARGLGIRGTASDILTFVVSRRAAAPLPTTRRSLLGVDHQQYGFLFGTGLFAQFLEVYYEGSEPGPAKAAWLLCRAVGSSLVGGPLIRRIMAPYQGSVEVDEVTWPADRWMMVTAGTTDDIGFGFRPFWKCLTHPGHVHVLGVATMNPLTVLREMPRMYRARQVKGEGMFDAVAHTLVLRSQAPITYALDGDFHQGGTELIVHAGPAVDFVVPSSHDGIRPRDRGD